MQHRQQMSQSLKTRKLFNIDDKYIVGILRSASPLCQDGYELALFHAIALQDHTEAYRDENYVHLKMVDNDKTRDI